MRAEWIVFPRGLATWLLPCALLAVASGCGGGEVESPEAPPMGITTKKVGELERLGPDGMDYLVLGVDVQGFEALTPEQRVLAYYLYRAAIAGDRIFTDQSHRYALEIQSLMEALHLNRQVLTLDQGAAVLAYLKLLWVNHGPYDYYSNVKFAPSLLTPSMLRDAAHAVAAAGVDLEPAAGEDLDAKLDRLEPFIFDPDVEPLLVNQEKGADIIATSAVNLYAPGINQEMLDRVDPAWLARLNVRFDLVDGEVVPQPYEIGGSNGRDLETVAFFLEKAAEHAESAEQAEGLRALVESFRTGDEESFREYAVHWLRSRTVVDYLNGFIESYKDPRAVIGQFEANVSFVADSTLLDALAGQALYFEERMPWPDRYKRRKIETPVANVVQVLVETADMGPHSPAAYNLPNYSDIRRDVGSKNIVLSNIEGARSEAIETAIREEFYLPHLREVRREYGAVARQWLVYMHEVIGHGSGMPEPDLEADPAVLIGRAYNALEECRADLVALYQISDPKLVEIGAFTAQEQPQVVQAAYVRYLQKTLVDYRRIPAPTVREAHRRGRQLVLAYLSGGGVDGKSDFGVEIVERDGKHYVDVTDVDKARHGVGDLLGRLQSIKSTGDAQRATDLFARFGTDLDPALHREIHERAAKLKIPRTNVFVFPRMIPKMEGDRVVDAWLVFDEDLTTQQLRFGRWRYNTSIPAE